MTSAISGAGRVPFADRMRNRRTSDWSGVQQESGRMSSSSVKAHESIPVGHPEFFPYIRDHDLLFEIRGFELIMETFKGRES